MPGHQPALQSAQSSLGEHSHGSGMSTWLRSPPKAARLQKIVFQQRIHGSRGNGKGTENAWGPVLDVFSVTAWTLVTPSRVPGFALSQTAFELYFMASTTLKGFVRRSRLKTVFRKTAQSLADRAHLFCRVYFPHSFFLFTISRRHMLLSRAHLLMQSIPQPVQAGFHAEKWQQGWGGHKDKCLNVLILHWVLHWVSICDNCWVLSQLGRCGIRSAGVFCGPSIAFWAINRGAHLPGNCSLWVVLSVRWDLAALVH